MVIFTIKTEADTRILFLTINEILPKILSLLAPLTLWPLALGRIWVPQVDMGYDMKIAKS